LSDHTFLLVDDSDIDGRILEAILKSAGYSRFRHAKSAEEALSILEGQVAEDGGKRRDETGTLVDIVLTDLSMPDMNGIELCRRIRGSPNHAGMPVIMMTASENVKDIEEAFRAGVMDYITKPYSRGVVLSRIKATLRLYEEMGKREDRERELAAYNKNLTDDLGIARHLQRQLLQAPVATGQISINGFYLPVAFLGGDLYYWQRISEDEFCIILLDVMGHGTATSLICMYIRANLPELVLRSTGAADLARGLNKIVIELNRNLAQDEYYCAAFFMTVNTRERTLEYVNAGQPSSAFIGQDGKTRWLDKGCLPLGVFGEMTVLPEKIGYVGKSSIFLYTDGLFELFKKNTISIEYLLNYTKVYGKSTESGFVVVEKLFSLIEQLPREDDVSLVYVELYPGGG